MPELNLSLGEEMYGWARHLWPICRSITGPGVRETLAYLRGILPGLEVHSVPSGTPVFDWEVPEEWSIRDAYIADELGRRLVDFRRSNLHVIGYSVPVDCWLSGQELQPYLHSLPEMPKAIPYRTSYYSRTWGFCLTEEQRRQLSPAERFHVVIDSTLGPGVLNYADLVIPGETDDEVLLSTYVCHPSMANNELSGPVVAAALGRWLSGLARRRYTYRLVFAPETIGAVVYIAAHLEHLRSKTKAGFVLTCLGDERAYSYVPSRRGSTLADRVARAVLEELSPGYVEYSFLERGSDERQYCSPGVDLPVASVMRTRYGAYPEYHTSLDDLQLVTPRGLAGGYAAIESCIRVLESNGFYRTAQPCEPQLGRRGLYPNFSERDISAAVQRMMNVLAHADGSLDCIDLARASGTAISECIGLCQMLTDHGVMVRLD